MYIAAFLLAMLSPICMIIMGVKWLRKMPTRDQFFSYRSEMALKNDETWAFAHEHICKLWIRIGIITAIISIILLRVFADSYSTFILWLIMGQMVFFCGSVFFIDSIMQAVFDEDGNRII